MKKLFIIFAALLLTLMAFDVRAEESNKALKYLPVQDGGRVKPYDSFAREVMTLVYGRQKYEGRPAYEIVFTWLLHPEGWVDRPVVEINHAGLKEALRLDKKQKHFSVTQIMSSDRLSLLLQDLTSKRQTKEKLDPYFQAVQRLENQLFTIREVGAGRLPGLVPPSEGDRWLTAAEMGENFQELFIPITKAFANGLGQVKPDAVEQQSESPNTTKAVENFVQRAAQENPLLYPKEMQIKTEVLYNSLHPFMISWILYLLGGLLALAAWLKGGKFLYANAWGFMILGLLMHTFGFALRVYLTGRPPVSNMYETVVWVSWGAVAFAMIIEKIYRYRFILLSGAIVGVFCLILADMAPAILDSSLQPLEPVLRSNFWLLVHVLTITISYSAFFLAFVLGDIGLIFVLKGENKSKHIIDMLSNGIYRSVQIGVVLLAAGTILGGIWADYSWGRFWGWDPKETWALIALLGYLAVLHGRLVGWLKSYGMLVTAILAFSLVIMAWYGVNYVLGAGLHSYGFGAGGVEYVSAFVLVHVVYVVFVSVIRRGRVGSSAD